MKCELDLFFQDHLQRFDDFNMWFVFIYFFSLMHSNPCFYLTCSTFLFLFVWICNAYGRSGKHKPVGDVMKYDAVELPYHERTFKHASQVRRTKTHPTIFSESSMTVRRASCSPLSPSPVLKWYKILMCALWISFSWNLAKALKVCELGDMHEKENRKNEVKAGSLTHEMYSSDGRKKKEDIKMHGLYFGICMYMW